MVRIKHRYLLVNILYPDTTSAQKVARLKGNDDVPLTVQFHQPSSDRLDARHLMKVIRDGVSELFGDYGSGMIAGSLQVKYLSAATSTAIIRVSRDHYRLVWAALTFTTRLPKPVDQPCVMQVVRVSGTIKKSEEEAIRRARTTIKRAQSRTATSLKHAGLGSSSLSAMGNQMDEMEEDSGFADGIEDPDEPGDIEDESE